MSETQIDPEVTRAKCIAEFDALDLPVGEKLDRDQQMGLSEIFVPIETFSELPIVKIDNITRILWLAPDKIIAKTYAPDFANESYIWSALSTEQGEKILKSRREELENEMEVIDMCLASAS